jgi:hypothetical protein
VSGRVRMCVDCFLFHRRCKRLTGLIGPVLLGRISCYWINRVATVHGKLGHLGE